MGKIFSLIAARFLSVLILTFWVGTALADKRVALIIGNSQYTRISPKLANPANDLHDIAQALQGIGFEVILRTDVGKGDFDRSLAEFARKASGADTALFYYAGHGLQYQRQNFFLPVDIEVQDAADVEFQAVGMDRVLEAINKAEGVKIVILDACRDNPLAKQFMTRSLNGGGATRGLARIDRTEGLIIAYATAPDQVAQDGAGRNSPFTESLIRRIKEPGLEIGTMFRRVTSDVFEETNGRQRPEISISLLTDFFLNPAVSDSIEWGRVRDSDNIDAFKEFIRKFPTSPFAREAQARIDLFEKILRLNEQQAKNERACVADRKTLDLLKGNDIGSLKTALGHMTCDAVRADAQQRLAKLEDDERACVADRKTLDLLKGNDIGSLKTALGHMSCDAVRADAQQRLAKLEDDERACVADRKTLDLLKGNDIGSFKTALGHMSCDTVRVDAQQRLAKLEDDKRGCDADRTTLGSLKDNDIGSLKTALGHMTCDAVRVDAQQRLAKLEDAARACDADRQTLASLKDNDVGSLKTALGHMTCDTVRADAQQRLAKLEDEKRACDADRKTLGSLKDNDIGSLKAALGHMSCDTVRVDAQQRLAKLEGNEHACEADRKTLGSLKDNDIGSLKAALGHMTCDTVRADAQQRLAKLEGNERACDADRKTLGSLKDNDIGSLKAAVDHMTCDTVRADAQKRVAKLEDDKRACDADRTTLASLKDNDIGSLKAALDRMTCDTVRADAQKRVARLEDTERACVADRTTLASLKDNDIGSLKTALGHMTCDTVRADAQQRLAKLEGAERACVADRKTLASLKDNDIGSLKAALGHMTCDTVRADAQQRLAKLGSEIQREQQICTDEKTKLDAIDASAAGARQQYVEFQAHAACPSLHAEISGIIKTIDLRVKDAQKQLTRLGCYNASINGKFDEATQKSLALYHTKKGSFEDGDHLTDGLLSELKQQNLGLCPTEPPSAPVVATPGNGAPTSTQAPPKQKSEQAKREEEPASRPSRKHKVQSAAHEQEPASRPPRHKMESAAREEAPAPRSRQRPHPSVVAERPKAVVAPAPRMPPSQAAEHVGHIGGVGF